MYELRLIFEVGTCTTNFKMRVKKDGCCELGIKKKIKDPN